jgi:transketolase
LDLKRIRQQFADTMLEVGQKDPNLIVLIGDISHFILQPYAKACPGRFYNVGICEPTIVSMAAGLAKVGFYPVVHTIAPFLIERSFEQFKLDFCYQQLGGNVITVGSAFDYSNLGCTHHCYGDFALIKSLPNTQIVYPASCDEFDILFKQSYNNKQLTLFRLTEHQHDQQIDQSLIEFGKAIKVAEGRDLTVVAAGPQLKNAVGARKELLNKGWDLEVIYVHTIKPLDLPLIHASINKTKKVLVIEEHNRFGGLEHDILTNICDIGHVQSNSIAIDSFIHDYGSYDDLCSGIGLTVDGIEKTVINYFKK